MLISLRTQEAPPVQGQEQVARPTYKLKRKAQAEPVCVLVLAVDLEAYGRGCGRARAACPDRNSSRCGCTADVHFRDAVAPAGRSDQLLQQRGKGVARGILGMGWRVCVGGGGAVRGPMQCCQVFGLEGVGRRVEDAGAVGWVDRLVVPR